MATVTVRSRPWYVPSRIGLALREARRYPVVALSILMFLLVVPAVLAPYVAPHDPLKGSLAKRLTTPVWHARGRAGVTLSIIMFLLVVPAVLAPYVAPHDPLKGSLAKRLTPPVWQDGGSATHLLGTDKLGRDILSRLIYGARVSLTVSAIAIFVGGIVGTALALLSGYLRARVSRRVSASAIFVGGIVGTALGLISGYFGGRIDALLMRLVDISLSLPTILLALVLVAAVGPSFSTVLIVLVVLLWARYARLVRAETLALKERDFIARGRVAGASHTRIMVHYIFPNVVNSLVVLATLQVGYVILLESALSFLGAGLPRPLPAWGLMVADGRELSVTAWCVSMFPGLAIMLTVLSLNLLGDWLRDHYDPKLRNVSPRRDPAPLVTR